MLKENWRFISRIERFADNAIIIACFFAAYYGRGSLLIWDEVYGLGLPFDGEQLAPLKDYFIALVVSLISYNTALNFSDAYGSMRLATPLRLFRIAVLSTLFTFMSLAATLFLIKVHLSRVFVLLFLVLTTLSLTAERSVVLALLRFWRRRGLNFRNVIISGVGDQACKLSREIALRPELGVKICAFVNLAPDRILPNAELPTHIPVLNASASVEDLLKNTAVDEIIFTDSIEVMPEIQHLIVVAADQGIRTTLAADLFSIGLVKSGLSYFADIPLIHFQTPPGDRWELGVKRLIDIVVSAIMLVVFMPLILLIAGLIKFTSPGPVFFKQTRVGLNGRLFKMLKFRSMQVDAEEMLPELQKQNQMSGPAFKLAKDPRITGVGRWLRRFSLDELPQLINVLIGEMSLVGPRPPVPGEVKDYERRYRRRLSMRPGMTCIWQVSGRNNISNFEDWVQLDLKYIDNWSLASDFALLLRTVPAVLLGTGAR